MAAMPSAIRTLAVLLLCMAAVLVVPFLGLDRHYALPLLAVTAAALACPAGLLMWKALPREQQRVRRARGQCAGCGYDLTANVSGACPECGAANA